MSNQPPQTRLTLWAGMYIQRNTIPSADQTDVAFNTLLGATMRVDKVLAGWIEVTVVRSGAYFQQRENDRKSIPKSYLTTTFFDVVPEPS